MVTENGGLRDDAQAITPTDIPSTGRLHKPGFDGSCPHEIASFGVPRRRTGDHNIGSVYGPSVLIAPREWSLKHLLKSATAPVSRVIFSFAYSHRQVKKSTIKFMAVFPGCQRKLSSLFRRSHMWRLTGSRCNRGSTALSWRNARSSRNNLNLKRLDLAGGRNREACMHTIHIGACPAWDWRSWLRVPMPRLDHVRRIKGTSALYERPQTSPANAESAE